MRYNQIRECDIANGEGIGCVLFVQGCNFRCKGCFNTETWDFNGGIEWTEEIENKFLELIDRPYIKRITILGGEPLTDENLSSVLHLVQEIRKKYPTPQYIVGNKEKYRNILNENSNEIRVLCPEKTIWLYTGYDFVLLRDKFNEYKYSPFGADADEWLTRWKIISQCNVIVDGRYIDSLRDISLKFRGSSNQRVIDVQKSIKNKEVVLYCD